MIRCTHVQSAILIITQQPLGGKAIWWTTFGDEVWALELWIKHTILTVKSDDVMVELKLTKQS
jgi:DNA-directed RNA polymerase beta subunit